MSIGKKIKIQIEYDKMMDAAKKLQKAAQNCDDAAMQLRHVTTGILTNWEGNAGLADFYKIQESIQRADKFRDDYLELANKIKKKAENLRANDTL